MMQESEQINHFGLDPAPSGGRPGSPSAASADDAALVDRIRRSQGTDIRAFETLVARHQARVYRWCRRFASSADEAEDLAQEAFIKAYYGIQRFQGRASFTTWLHRVVVNHCLNYKSRRRYGVFLSIDDPDLVVAPELQDSKCPEESARTQDERQRILDVLDRMSDRLRISLVLRDGQGLSYQEIADQLQLGLSATKMRIKRARAEFRQLYGGNPAGMGDCSEPLRLAG